MWYPTARGSPKRYLGTEDLVSNGVFRWVSALYSGQAELTASKPIYE